MAEPRRPSRAPWITAAVAGVVLIALLLVYLLWLRPDEDDANREHAAALQNSGRLTSDESAAMTAAGTEMVNLVTFSRAHFEDDFQRALAGATGSLRTDVEKQRDNTLKTMTDGKFDLFGRLTHKALSDTVSADGKSGYVVLVTINGYRSTAPDSPIQQNLAVTVLKIDGKWLATDVTNIGVTG
ncbi:MAG: hypothetical protein QOH89_115 [Pseudonocardiales bacterium]|jgi:hypothetical protein|nr:hypothetical protein [Pseudonocardiales bacterium]MDT4941655.1 hypothetical protein [Pseudonocardiales bacterium]